MRLLLSVLFPPPMPPPKLSVMGFEDLLEFIANGLSPFGTGLEVVKLEGVKPFLLALSAKSTRFPDVRPNVFFVRNFVKLKQIFLLVIFCAIR